jgi:gliding motility-associated protein GldM
MGATNCPETPRQRLIAMMYLVLTALLALNVSKEILDSFIIVNESLEITNENFTKKIGGTYDQFAKQMAINPGKVEEKYNLAMEAKKLSKEMIDYIETVKATVISKEGRIPIEQARGINIRNVSARDKYDEGTNYLFGTVNDGSAGEARIMRNKIADYKKKMMDLIDPKFQHKIKMGLDIEGPFYDADQTQVSWELYHFYHTILAANVVILNKLINEVKNTEFDIVSELFSEISAEDFKFDKIGAKVVPKSSYVLTGDTYEADIFVAAYDTKQTPIIEIGDAVDTINNVVLGNKTTVEGHEGVGKLKIPAGGVGERKYGGIIKITNAFGDTEHYPFSGSYIVAQPSATISPTAMNVLYIGVDNPVSISVPGVASEKIRPNISGGGGTIKSDGKGAYTVNVTTSGKATISVAAEVAGSTKNMGSMEFRVKRVPNPIAYIGNVNSGKIAKNVLLASAIIPRMGDDFEFELYYRITSYTLGMNYKGEWKSFNGTGNTLTAEMKDIIGRVGKGTRVVIDEIRASGPDTRSLTPMVLRID